MINYVVSLKKRKSKKKKGLQEQQKEVEELKLIIKSKKILRKLTLIWGYKWNRGRRIKWKS